MTDVDAPVVAEFDLVGPEVIADPYPTYRAMREAGALLRLGATWYVTRYDLAEQVLRSAEFGRGDYPRMIEGALGPGPLAESFRRWILYLDPPDHTRLRRLVMRAFTPKAIARLRSVIQTTVDRLLDEMSASGETDLLTGFAYPLPVHVICELLGVPTEDRSEFRTWSADLGRGLQITNLTPEVVQRGDAAAEGFNTYFRDLIVERRAAPHEGFLDDLIAVGDRDDQLSDDELLATLVLLFFAGHETTVNLLGNGMNAILRDRESWQQLCDDPDLARTAVEEMLRIDTPVQRASRIALVDTVLDGRPVAAGEMVVILIGGANRDERRIEDPDRFRLDRPDTPHLSFAAGPHYCLGATLARAEAEIAVATLARRFPELMVASDSLAHRANVVLRGLEALPVLGLHARAEAS